MADLIENITTPQEEQQLVRLLSGYNYLLERNYATRMGKIDGLEMAGAILLFNDGNHEKFPLAFQHWRRALSLRLMDTEDCRPIYKTPLKSKSGQLSEWTTLDDLQRIEQQPAQRKIQSLLVRLRIFSIISWETVHRCFIPPFLQFLRTRRYNGSLFNSEILDLTWATLDTILRSERPHESSVHDSVHEIMDEIFFQFNGLPKDSPNLNSEILMKLVELVWMTDLSQLRGLPDPNYDDPNASEMLTLCTIIMHLSRFPAESITEEARISLLQLLHRDDRDKEGYNLLHTACYCFVSSSETLSTIRFLVKLGADLNAVNNDGDGVLHIVSWETFPSLIESRDAKGHLFIELGAHLDMVNKEGMTAADVWLKQMSKLNGQKVGWRDLPDWLKEGVPSLKCLSSRVIRRHKIPYDDGAILPAVLIPFVSLH